MAEMSPAATTTQFRFTPGQKKMLVEYWQKGMQTCSKAMVAMINECASSVQCTEERVKVRKCSTNL